MLSERIEALLVPSFLQAVAGRSATCFSLDDLKVAVQANKIHFNSEELAPMFAEADFRHSGFLSCQELVAALSGAQS